MMSVSDHTGVLCKSDQHSSARVGLAVWRRAKSRAAVQTSTIWSDEQPEANSGVLHKQTALGAACLLNAKCFFLIIILFSSNYVCVKL